MIWWIWRDNLGFREVVVAAEMGRMGLLGSLVELIALRVLSIPNLIYNDFDLKIIKQKLAKYALAIDKGMYFDTVLKINQILQCVSFILYY